MTKELIYKPLSKAHFSHNRLLGAFLFLKIAALSGQFLIKSLKEKIPLAIADEYIKKFWHLNLSMTHTTLYCTGKSNLDYKETYLYLSNHNSWMDFASMFASVPGSLRMVAKQGLMQIPIFGQAMREAGFIAIDRKNRHKAIEQLEIAKKRLNEGISIWMSPEGTRSRSGEIAQFKKGGFYLAKDLNVPIVPVYIEGAAQVMPPDDLMVYPNRTITVHFMAPIWPKGDIQELIEEVRKAIVTKQKLCQQTC